MALLEKFEAEVRTAPLQATGIALASGWLLTKLPVLGLLGLAIRVALALVKPALLILGGAKAWDLLKARRAETSQAFPENHF